MTSSSSSNYPTVTNNMATSNTSHTRSHSDTTTIDLDELPTIGSWEELAARRSHLSAHDHVDDGDHSGGMSENHSEVGVVKKADVEKHATKRKFDPDALCRVLWSRTLNSRRQRTLH